MKVTQVCELCNKLCESNNLLVLTAFLVDHAKCGRIKEAKPLTPKMATVPEQDVYVLGFWPGTTGHITVKRVPT